MRLRALRDISSTVGVIRKGSIFNEYNPMQAQEWVDTGYAEDPSSRRNARGWEGLNWSGNEVVIMASGESLSQEQADAVNFWRMANLFTRKVIAINTTFRRAPWADAIYACDLPWWDYYHAEVKEKCIGSLWTQDSQAASKYSLQHIRSHPSSRLEKQIGLISQGQNSGMQAIGLAFQAAASTVYLLGYDMKGGHWHGKHPASLDKQNRYDIFLRNFEVFAKDVEQTVGFEVYNCTPKSRLRSFPMKEWKEVFPCP